MYRKLFFSLLIVVLLAGIFSASALAMEGDGNPDGAADRERPRAVRGEITALAADGGSFKLTIRNGETLTFLVTEETQFRGQVGSFADLEVGNLAAVGFVPRDAGLVARQVVVHEHLDRVGRVGGKVLEVDQAEGTFVLGVPQRGETTFQTDDQTRFQGAVSGLEDLPVNQIAHVAFVRSEEQPFRALLVAVPERQPVQRFIGQIQSVEFSADKFTLETRQGTVVDLVVDDQTQFRSPTGEINGLADLEAGMTAAVGGVPQDDGSYLTKWVGATDQALPKAPIRVQGKIAEADQGKFSVETPDGSVLNFLVTEATVFRSRGGEIDGVEDLEPGMRVGVGAELTGEGVLQANIVLVGR